MRDFFSTLLEHAMAVAKQTRKFSDFEKCKEELLQSVVEFAMWIEKHHVDEPESGREDGGQLGVDEDS